MKTKVFKGSDRGHANYGWLNANYSFSFSNYYDPNRQNFGALRVLNDDLINGGAGFGEHPHQNMEIISVPLAGTLKHKDSMSNTWIPLHTGEVQVMSAGKGIYHSEKNASSGEIMNLFQIWIIPEQMDVEPRYDQKRFEPQDRKNKLQVLVSSFSDESESLKIHQDARISRIDLEAGRDISYHLKTAGHGAYFMLISGEVEIGEEKLEKRDAFGTWDTESVDVRANAFSELLIIEVPMVF